MTDNSKNPSGGIQQTSESVQNLIDDLQARIRKDFVWQGRYRSFHRSVGVLLTVLLIALPAALAVGFVATESISGRAALWAITVAGALSSAFKPYLHSQYRRTDMSSGMLLLDEFKVRLVEAQGDDDQLLTIYKEFSKRFNKHYVSRGGRLIAQNMAAQEIPKKEGLTIP